MRATRIVSLAVAAMAFWLEPTRPLSAAARQEDPNRDKAEHRTPNSNDTIDAAIEKRIQGKASLDDVKIEAQWRRKTGMTSTRVYGNGVGIWRDTTQFQLSREQVLDLLRAFEQARFGAMPKQYGSDEEGEDEGEREKGKPKEKTYFQGIIGLRIGTEQKRVAQSMTGEQSPAFLKLAEKVIAVSEKAAKTGIGAKSLGDGLSKLAAGKLAPETLQLLVRRKADRPGPGAEDGNWTLRLDGRRAVDTTVSDEKTSTKRLLVLSQEDFRKLGAVLAENDPAGLPRNLYSPQYLTVDVRLLKDHRDISARRYAGTTAETHGAKQAAFDRIYAALLTLHARVEKEGGILPANSE
jgi:hypothetical protein